MAVKYNDDLNKILSSHQDASALSPRLCSLVDSVLSESMGIVATRPILTSIIQCLDRVPSTVKINVGQHILRSLQSNTTSYEELEYGLRESLAATYEAEEDYVDAAKTLQEIHLDTSQRHVSDEDKVRMWVRIVRLYLEEDDTVSAESYLNRIKNLSSSSETLAANPELKLPFQLAQARILDARHRFLDASAEYYNVSLSPVVAEDDRVQALAAAITAAVLAGAGPPRSKALAKLYRDDRASSTDEFSILEKLFLDRLLSPEEVATFAAKLQPHQLAQTADGSTVLDKAVIEHNLLATSKLYENISTPALAALLGLRDGTGAGAGNTTGAVEKAEDYASRMFEQDRLRGEIDQIEGVIYFHAGDQGTTGTGVALTTYDAGVQGLVEQVERCAAAVAEAYPAVSVSADAMVH